MKAPLVAVVGPTGSGKSRLALQAATETGAAIVAIDAFTVYRGMDIGTAKPTAAEQASVLHHMVDVLDVEQDCTVQWFQARAREVIDALRASGTPVLLVGGSGLYFRAVVDPLEFPPTDPAVRADVQQEVEADVPAAFDRLSRRDSEAASRMDPLNSRRITRALEVIELTGRTFSSFRTNWDAYESMFEDLTVIGTRVERDLLTNRIARRTETMLAQGWVEECQTLLGRDLSVTAAQAIGYREIMGWLDKAWSVASDADVDPPVPDDLKQHISIRTRQFANRQRRWFAADPRVQWFDPAVGPDPIIRALRSSP